MEMKWIETDDYELAMFPMKLKNGQSTPVFWFIERDPKNKASQEKLKNLDMKKLKEGIWITNKFVNTQTRKLDIKGMLKFLQSEKFNPRVVTITREKNIEIIQKANVRAEELKVEKRNTFSQVGAEFLDYNMNGEEVFTSENGERLVRRADTLLYAGESNEVLSSFLIMGTIKNNNVELDIGNATSYLLGKIEDQDGWQLEDTADAISMLTQATTDIYDADNIENVINELHGALNENLSNTITPLLEKAKNGEDETRNVRNSLTLYNKYLPLFKDGEPVEQDVISPLAQHVINKFEAVNLRVNPFIPTNPPTTLFEPGEEQIVLFVSADEPEIKGDERRFYEDIQHAHSIHGIFEIGRVTNNEVDSAHRFIVLNKDAGLTKSIPATVKSTRSITEAISLTEKIYASDEPLPFSRDELESYLELDDERSVKTLPYDYVASDGGEPNKYVVPAALQQPLRLAKENLLESVGDLPTYVAEKLDMARTRVAEVFSKGQIETIAQNIKNHEEGKGIIVGNGTGTGKTRIIAAMIRYRAIRNEKSFFTTTDKELFNGLYKELAIIDSIDVVNPLVASDDPILDEDGNPLMLSDGQTSEEHFTRFKKFIKDEAPIPDDINLVMASYYAFNQKPQFKDASGKIKPFTKFKKHEKAIRIYDSTKMLEKYLKSGDTLAIFDESHYASGNSNTGANAMVLTRAATNLMYSSATYAKNVKKMRIYNRAIPDGITPTELEEMLNKGGLDVIEGFTMKMASTGMFTTYQMPTDDVKYITRSDDNNRKAYMKQNDEFANVVAKMKAISERINDALLLRKEAIKRELEKKIFDDDLLKNAERSFGFRTLNPFSRFTKLNELKITCEKAEFIAKNAIEDLKNGKKPWIPTEITSETNIKYVASRDDAPVFSEQDIEDGKHTAWLDRQNNEGKNGFVIEFSDVLRRALLQTLQVKVPTLNGFDDKNRPIVDKVPSDAREFIQSMMGDYHLAQFMELIAQCEEAIDATTSISASPIDEIKLAIEKAGFSVSEYSGRSVEIKEDEKGRRYLMRRNALNSIVRENFQSGALDAVICTRSGFTGKEWHAEQGKDERQRIAYRSLPVSSPDLEKQLLGRLVRTGMANAPMFVDVNTGLLPEKRLFMQADYRRRSLDAGTTGDANFNYKEGEVYLFSEIGNNATYRYFTNNPELFAKLGFSDNELEKSTKDFAMVATARLQLLRCDEGEEIMRGIEREYFRVIEELEAQGIKPFGDQTLHWDADLDKKILVAGTEGTDDPWDQPVYAAKLIYQSTEANITSDEVSAAIVSAKKGLAKRTLNKHVPSSPTLIDSSGKPTGFIEGIKEMESKARNWAQSTGESNGYYTQRADEFLELKSLVERTSIGDVLEFEDYAGEKQRGVLTGLDIEIFDNSASILVMVPGEAKPVRIFSHSIHKRNAVPLGMQFDKNSKIAKQFDETMNTQRRSRMVFLGDAFSMQREGIKGARSYLKGFSPRVMNITIKNESGKAELNKVILLPKKTSMHDIVSRPIQMRAVEASHYIKAIRNSRTVAKFETSMDYKRGQDIKLAYFGEKNGDHIYKVTVGRTGNKDILNSQAIKDLDVKDDAFPEKTTSAAATMFIKESNLDLFLTKMEDFGKTFISHSYGGEYINQFNKGNPPQNYDKWKAEQAKKGMDEFLLASQDSNQTTQSAVAIP